MLYEVITMAEFTLELSFGFELFQPVFYHFDKKNLCLDPRNLNVAVRVAVHKQLTLDVVRKRREHVRRILRKVFVDPFGLRFEGVQGFVVICLFGKQVVQLTDKRTDFGDEFYKSLRYKNHAEILTVFRSLYDDFRYIIYNFIEACFVCFNFF